MLLNIGFFNGICYDIFHGLNDLLRKSIFDQDFSVIYKGRLDSTVGWDTLHGDEIEGGTFTYSSICLGRRNIFCLAFTKLSILFGITHRGICTWNGRGGFCSKLLVVYGVDCSVRGHYLTQCWFHSNEATKLGTIRLYGIQFEHLATFSIEHN